MTAKQLEDFQNGYHWYVGIAGYCLSYALTKVFGLSDGVFLSARVIALSLSYDLSSIVVIHQ